MSPIAHIRKTLWTCSCISCNILNLSLAILALGLGGLVVLNLFQKSIPIPDKLASWIINQSSPGHLQSKWTKAVFDLRAGLYLSGFELRNTKTEQIILTADETYLRWSPLHILVPDSPIIEEIDASGIEVYVPVSHSPSGLNEPVISINHVFSKEKDGILIIESLLLKTGGLRIHLNGKVPIQRLLEEIGSGNSRGTTTRNPSSLYRSLQKIGRLPKDLNADINARWEMLDSGSHVFYLNGFLPKFIYKQVGMGKISWDAVLLIVDNKLAIRDLDLWGTLTYKGKLPRIPFLNIPDDPVPIPFHLSADDQPLTLGEYQLPSKIRLSLHPDDSHIKFQHLILQTTLNESLDSSIDWILMGPSAFASGNTIPRYDSDTPPIFSFPRGFEFRAYLPNSSIYQFLDAPLPHRLLVGTRADAIRLNASFDLDKLHLQGNTVTDGLNIGQTQFDHLFAKLVLDPQYLVLDQVIITKSQVENAYGFYSQHFPSSKFSLNAAGFIFPSSLDSILGDWWTNVFTHIEASQPLPGDVTVWGHWRDAKSLKSVTEVHGPGIKYRGVEIPEMELRVRSNNRWTYLDALRAEFPTGIVKGTIAIQSGMKETDTHRAYLLDLMSTAPWEVVLGATGLKSLEILDFHEANPHLDVKGILWRDSGKGFESKEAADLEFRIMQRDGHCLLKTLEISGLTVDGQVKGNRLELAGLSGQFAKGIFTGSISITDWQNEERTHQIVDIDLINADYRIAREQLSGFVGMGATPSARPGTEENLGRLDAEMRLGFGIDLESYSGNGNVSIHEGKLGKVNMFGELSHLLGTMGLGFTTVEMNTLYLDWDLAGPALEIRNGLVTGPALNLTLGGWVDLETRGLQMKSDVTLFSGLFSKVLSPVSDTLQFDLVGTIEDPEWKIRFNPFRWALNRMNDLGASPQN